MYETLIASRADSVNEITLPLNRALFAASCWSVGLSCDGLSPVGSRFVEIPLWLSKSWKKYTAQIRVALTQVITVEDRLRELTGHLLLRLK